MRLLLVPSIIAILACSGLTSPKSDDDDDDEDTARDGDADTDADSDADADADRDRDGDGYTEAEGDCDDGDDRVNPESAERCDDVDNNCDGRTDEGGVCDTTTTEPGDGTAVLYNVGSFETSRGSFTTGTWGNGFYGMDSGRSVCDVVGELGRASTGQTCTDCEWSFEFADGIENSTASGTDCSAIGASDGSYDGVFAGYSFAFAEDYTFESGGNEYLLDAVVLLGTGRDWYIMAYNYGSYRFINGDAESLTVEQPLAGYYYYY